MMENKLKRALLIGGDLQTNIATIECIVQV